MFEVLKRSDFRQFYQPSRIALGIVPVVNSSRVNIITLCFNMHASYRPPMMAFAVHKKAFSRKLFEEARECVLAIPGERLAAETLFCGLETGGNVDKVEACKLDLCQSSRVAVPGLARAIANIQLKVCNRVVSGDHLTIFGEVLEYAVNPKLKERNLLSVGPEHKGFKVLAEKGIHRIAVVERFDV